MTNTTRSSLRHKGNIRPYVPLTEGSFFLSHDLFSRGPVDEEEEEEDPCHIPGQTFEPKTPAVVVPSS